MSPMFAMEIFPAQTHQCDGSQGKAFCPAEMLLAVPKPGWSALGRAGARLRSLPLPAPRRRHKTNEGIRHMDTKFRLNTG